MFTSDDEEEDFRYDDDDCFVGWGGFGDEEPYARGGNNLVRRNAIIVFQTYAGKKYKFNFGYREKFRSDDECRWNYLKHNIPDMRELTISGKKYKPAIGVGILRAADVGQNWTDDDYRCFIEYYMDKNL